MSERELIIHDLHRRRPRSRLVRWSGLTLALLGVYAWVATDIGRAEFFSARHMKNVSRFLDEVRPAEVRDGTTTLLSWAGDYLATRGFEAAAMTLAISITAILIAGFLAAFFSLLAARTLSSSEPWLPSTRRPSAARRAAWWSVSSVTRLGFVFVRAIPEYVWAFLFFVILGPTPWTAVLALAIHNFGVLGRLDAETIENIPRAVPAALRGAGGTRWQIGALGILPTVLPRFLLYFFYRWETCLREATVLGLAGIVSLGYWLKEARAHNHYGEMLFLVMLGAAMVIAGDIISAVGRRIIRRAA